MTRQRRERVGENPREIAPPKSQQPGETLLFGVSLLLGRGHLRLHHGGEDLPLGIVELADRAGLGERCAQACRGCRACLGGVERRQDLAGRHRADISAPRISREAQRLLCCAKLRLFEADACELGPGWPGCERQDAGDDLSLDIELDRGLHPVVGKTWQGRPARLHHYGLGDAQPVIGGL